MVATGAADAAAVFFFSWRSNTILMLSFVLPLSFLCASLVLPLSFLCLRITGTGGRSQKCGSSGGPSFDAHRSSSGRALSIYFHVLFTLRWLTCLFRVEASLSLSLYLGRFRVFVLPARKADKTRQTDKTTGVRSCWQAGRRSFIFHLLSLIFHL